MAKFANKAKGRPTKRKTLKVKYKIERKVKQHNKRLKKQAKKLKEKGVKRSGKVRQEYLPNLFPFKQQLLDEARFVIQREQANLPKKKGDKKKKTEDKEEKTVEVPK